MTRYRRVRQKLTPRARPQRRGAILAIMPLMILTMLALAMFMVDLGYVYTTRSGLQNAGDAAGLAAALRLRIGSDNHSEVKSLALKFAALNQPDIENVLMDRDIEIGVWDFDEKQFTVDGSEANAVRVTARRDGMQSASLVLFFSRVFGVGDMRMDVTSVTAFDQYTLESGEVYRSMPYLVN